ncbi:WecB/TagA/CpsF family glycosyltransferase [Colwellia sp. D2M02]|uniref:WecB/TagA/CpsF family glycosyltransferase n=1 Tax=Colwellia sp. D2M02 TaxID=2841562 RepID=UPI001C09F085|nr:WecB/TagA/CpsF family glycosyltransferase [Colwellia sp. D2M02]
MKDLTTFNVTPFDSKAAVIEHIHQHCHIEKPYHIITANPEIIYEAVNNPVFANIFHQADLVIADGIGVALPLSWAGYQSERVPGIDVFEALLRDSKLGEKGVYLLGAKLTTVTKTAENLTEQGTHVCGYRDGFFSLDDKTISALTTEIKALNPSIIAIAMGAPRQDEVIALLKASGINGIFIGVGGAFDVLSGELKRAPSVWQKIKLEWLFRLLSDLRRLPRYKKIFSYFIWLFKG